MDILGLSRYDLFPTRCQFINDCDREMTMDNEWSA